MLDVSTNNYLESWQSLPKTCYFEKSTKQRIDALVHQIFGEILLNFKLKLGRIYLGLDCWRLSKSEVQQQGKYIALNPERAKKGITRGIVSEDKNVYLEVFRVKYYIREDQEHVVSLNAACGINHCSCEFKVKNNSVCKHMFLAQQV